MSHAKPDPEIYLKAARKLDCDPAASVAFEDSFVGIEAAKRAGMKCVGVSSRVSLPADVFVRSLAQLAPDAFDRLIG